MITMTQATKKIVEAKLFMHKCQDKNHTSMHANQNLNNELMSVGTSAHTILHANNAWTIIKLLNDTTPSHTVRDDYYDPGNKDIRTHVFHNHIISAGTYM